MRAPLRSKTAHVSFAMLTALSALVFIGTSATAATLTWNNSGTDFNAAASWNNGVLPSASPPQFTDTVDFNLVMVTDPVVTSGSATAVAGIVFDTLGSGYTLSSADLGGGNLAQLAIGTGGISANNVIGTNTI